MAKKFLIPIVIGIILILVGGFFWWQKREIKGSPKDYVIKETGEGKVIENKKAGLTVKAPEGWEIKKIEIEEGAIAFYPPDIMVDWKEGKIVLPLKKGCRIETSVGYGN